MLTELKRNNAAVSLSSTKIQNRTKVLLAAPARPAILLYKSEPHLLGGDNETDAVNFRCHSPVRDSCRKRIRSGSPEGGFQTNAALPGSRQAAEPGGHGQS